MGLDWDTLLSGATRRLHSSAIRDLLAVTAQPDVISFAGGLPAPEGFPVEALRESFDAVLRDDGAAALQYGPTEGYLPLRVYLAECMADRGIDASPEQVLITSGSQQALDLIGKALLSPGDTVLVEAPSYVGALQSLTGREVRYQTVHMDQEGLIVEQATRMLEAAAGDAGDMPRLLYTIPTFQNPSGVSMSRARREALLELAAHYGLPIIEDDPYSELRFGGKAAPALRALPRGEDTIYLSTFSKILAPGLRIGWMVAPRPLLAKLTLAKQGADLHSDSLVQRAILHYCRHHAIQETTAPLRDLYRARRDAMLDALARYFPAGARWTHPDGGLFLWVSLPEGIDCKTLLLQAVAQQRVAFVPGAAFYVDGSGANSMRLSYSVVDPATIEEGIRRLALVIEQHLGEHPQPVSMQ